MAAQMERALEELECPERREFFEREQRNFMKELAAEVNKDKPKKPKQPAYVELMDRRW